MRDRSNWRDVLPFDGVTLGPGCDTAAIGAVSVALGCPLPRELVTMLHAVNGIRDARCQYGWTVEQIGVATPRWWSNGLPADMIAIGDNGAGEPFCVHVDETSDECTVYHWSPITTELTPLASSLYSFWPQWLNGTITG